MLPSALIPRTKFCLFDDRTDVLKILTYRCHHRKQWIVETSEWLEDYGLSWDELWPNKDSAFKTSLLKTEISDKQVALMFRLAWSGGFSDECGC